MPLIDDDGRVFGRVNLIDLIVVVFLFAAIPLAYGIVLMLRPTRPLITSVTTAPIDNEERRLARGTLLAAKLKVKGSGFSPMLRASIGDEPALAFVFEHPNSADVLVGRVPPGSHDLVLFDGVVEVARAPKAVTIDNQPRASARVAGWLTDLEPSFAQSLQPGYRFPPDDTAFEIAALGPVRPGRRRLALGDSVSDVPREGRVERQAVLTLRCDPDPADGPCTVAGTQLQGPAPAVAHLPAPGGSLRLLIEEVIPMTPAQPARVQIRVAGSLDITAGDRDAFLDDRAAVTSAVAGGLVTLTLGADETREGWRYRGQLLKPGATLTIRTDQYDLTGQIQRVELRPRETKP